MSAMNVEVSKDSNSTNRFDGSTSSESNAFDGSDNSSDEDFQEPAAKKKRKRSLGKCQHCGIYVNHSACRHELVHQSNANQWKCAICSVAYSLSQSRRMHELRSHDFVRHPSDSSEKDIVRLTVDQLKKVKNLGFKFVRVQQTARLSNESYKTPASDDQLRQIWKANPIQPELAAIKTEEQNSSVYYRFQCSICGFRKKTAGQRNSHEYHAHNFAREMRDRTRKEAIKVKPGQSSQLKRIGTTFDQIQRSAITSYSLKKPIGKPNKSRQASNKVITLSESEDEVVVEQPKTPVVEETPSQMTSPIQTAVDVLSIEYLDSQLTPENRVLAPLVTPTVTSTVTPIILPTFEISPTKSLLNELIKMPRFVFYDQLQLSVKFNNLPNDWWLSEEKSGILFVKHQQLEWKGIEMGESFCRFLLSDSSGCVHCFCKPDCKQLAQDFVMSINGQVFSFLKLMDQIVPRFGFQSHLIITTPQDRAVIQHLKTEQFVVL